MKTLDTLIKLHKQTLDRLRRELGTLQGEFEQLEYVKEKLKSEHRKEMEGLVQHPEFTGFFGGYSAHVRERVEKIDLEIQKLQVVMDKKREEIAIEFAEQKKYEIARTNQIKKQLDQENSRNRQQLDEIAMQQYNRK